MISSSVDFPQPLGPTIDVTFPAGKRCDTLVSAVVGLPALGHEPMRQALDRDGVERRGRAGRPAARAMVAAAVK